MIKIERKIYITTSSNEKRNIIVNSTNIKRNYSTNVIRNYYEKLYANKADRLEEIETEVDIRNWKKKQ